MEATRRLRKPCYSHNMAGKKAVLNVTVDESLSEQVREAAKLEHTTISSVVERALREQLAWELKRLDGIRAIEEYFEEHGYPTPEEMAEADAQVAEEHRLAEEARAWNKAHGKVFRREDWAICWSRWSTTAVRSSPSTAATNSRSGVTSAG